MAEHLEKVPHRHRILRGLLLAGILACGALVIFMPASPYDLCKILALPPQLIPVELTRQGFHYELGTPTGSWDLGGHELEGQPDRSTCFISFGEIGPYGPNGEAVGLEVTPDLMLGGQAPTSVTLGFGYAPLVSEDEAVKVAYDILARAHLTPSGEFTREEFPRWGEVNLSMEGACSVGARQATWSLNVGLKDSEVSSYCTYNLRVKLA